MLANWYKTSVAPVFDRVLQSRICGCDLKMKNSSVLLSLSLAVASLAQTQPAGVVKPVVEACGFNGTVVCVNNYVCFLPRSHRSC